MTAEQTTTVAFNELEISWQKFHNDLSHVILGISLTQEEICKREGVKIGEDLSHIDNIIEFDTLETNKAELRKYQQRITSSAGGFFAYYQNKLG